MLANFLPIVGLIYSLIVLTDLSYAQAALKGGLLTDLWDANEVESRAALSGSDGEVRPFITDDARVVGGQLAQVEAWFRADKESGQQWFMLAYGPSDRLELTLGGVFGYERPEENSGLLFSYALPLLQFKYLFREYAPGKPPGVGIVAGSFLPVGRGSFRPPGYGTFGFLTVSQCFGQREDVLIHGNLGANYLHIDGANKFIHTWGLGTQLRVFGGMHFVGEFISGDPYVPGTGTAYQVGYRYFFSNLFQIDMTLGKGIGGEQPLPLWFSAGIRWVITRFQQRR